MNAKVLAYIIGEVTRQGHDVFAEEGARRVIWMQDAWNWAQFPISGHFPRGFDFATLDSALLVKHIGQKVEPVKNSDGFRRCNVRVGVHVAPKWEIVEVLMREWAESLPQLTPEEAYKNALLIHPFEDGNGRTFKIVYNMMSGTLNDPIMPPNFWNCANP